MQASTDFTRVDWEYISAEMVDKQTDTRAQGAIYRVLATRYSKVLDFLQALKIWPSITACPHVASHGKTFTLDTIIFLHLRTSLSKRLNFFQKWLLQMDCILSHSHMNLYQNFYQCWVLAFFIIIILIIFSTPSLQANNTTTNGLERQHEELKYNSQQAGADWFQLIWVCPEHLSPVICHNTCMHNNKLWIIKREKMCNQCARAVCTVEKWFWSAVSQKNVHPVAYLILMRQWSLIASDDWNLFQRNEESPDGTLCMYNRLWDNTKCCKPE